MGEDPGELRAHQPSIGIIDDIIDEEKQPTDDAIAPIELFDVDGGIVDGGEDVGRARTATLTVAEELGLDDDPSLKSGKRKSESTKPTQTHHQPSFTESATGGADAEDLRFAEVKREKSQHHLKIRLSKQFWRRVKSAPKSEKDAKIAPSSAASAAAAESPKTVSEGKLKSPRHAHLRQASDPFFDLSENMRLSFKSSKGLAAQGGGMNSMLNQLQEEQVQDHQLEEKDHQDQQQRFLQVAIEHEIPVPTLLECRKQLYNKENEHHKRRRQHSTKGNIKETAMDFLAAFYIYLVHMIGMETLLFLCNAVGATYFYIYYSDTYPGIAIKLDFSFLAFSVVFPLTFLIQTVFARRDLALSRFADFKAAILSVVLFTLTVDWPDPNGVKKPNLTGGRLALSDNFNQNVVNDAVTLVKLAYEYLSMPKVGHAKNLVFASKKRATQRVHAIQNHIMKRINDNMFDFTMHTEEMRVHGFPSGEASRLHQYHQYLQQRFEQLRILKYYRTPQATRSFGSAYIVILPWMTGPYFAWVYQDTNSNLLYTLVLAAFTFTVLLGLLNTEKGIEDPFCPDYRSWLPGIDSVKLSFEFATVLQAIQQHYAAAELRRQWDLASGSQQDLFDDVDG